MRQTVSSPSLAEGPGKMSDPTRYIPTLDGWRAIAILLVLTHHLGTAFYGRENYWASSPTRFGVIGVPIFFGLSGFLITALLLQEFQSHGRISLAGFYLRRSFRILPPLFVYISAVGLLGLLATRLELVSSFLFFRNYIPDIRAGLYTYHLWSLSVEEHFYLLWPLALCFLLRGRKSRNSRKTGSADMESRTTLKTGCALGAPPKGLASSSPDRRRAAASFALLLTTGGIALALGLWGSIDFHLHLLNRIAPVLDTPMRTDLRLNSLMWGCCAGIIFQKVALREGAVRLLKLPVFAAALLALVCSQITAIPLSAIWSSVLIPTLILCTATHPSWRVSAALEWPILRWIGRISYSLYLWQQLFLVPKWEAHPLPWAQSLPLSILLPFACAAASHVLIEQPAIRAGRKLARRFLATSGSRFGQVTGAAEAA